MCCAGTAGTAGAVIVVFGWGSWFAVHQHSVCSQAVVRGFLVCWVCQAAVHVCHCKRGTLPTLVPDKGLGCNVDFVLGSLYVAGQLHCRPCAKLPSDL
jgi:hypothetical protein